MKKVFILTCCLVFYMLFGCNNPTAPAQNNTEEDAFRLLDSTDIVLADKDDFSASYTLTTEKKGIENITSKYKVFLRTPLKKMTIVQLFPEKNQGLGYISSADKIETYNPISRIFSEVSIKSFLDDSFVRLTDIVKSENRWRSNFEVLDLQEGKLGKYSVDIITLKTVTTKPAYAFLRIYIRKDIPLILKEENFSGTNKLLRTVLITKYGKNDKGYIPLNYIIRDELNPGNQTTMILTDITTEKLPDKVFTKEFLEGSI